MESTVLPLVVHTRHSLLRFYPVRPIPSKNWTRLKPAALPGPLGLNEGLKKLFKIKKIYIYIYIYKYIIK